LANQKAIELYEKEKADVIFDSPNSAAGLAVSNQALLYKKLYFAVTSGTTRYTGDLCNRYAFHWAYNDYVLATSAGVWAADNLGKKWYTITADYALWEADERFVSRWECRCGSTLCRGRITGNDWKDKGLQERYKGHLISRRNALSVRILLMLMGRSNNKGVLSMPDIRNNF
jgi:hypothetical protein